MARMTRAIGGAVILWVVMMVLCSRPVSAIFPLNPITRTDLFHNRTTQGESGEPCTRIGRQCLAGLVCVNQTCICPEGQQGDGLIACTYEDYHLCVVAADPHLTGYSGARADVDLPCRYRLTRFVTDHRTAATPHAYCSMEVYATNELNLGQYYVRSIQISLGITDSGQQLHEQFEVKKFGVSDDKIFQFLSNVTKIRTVWGFSVHEQINGVDVFPTYDEENNFAQLSVPECATLIKYRAYDRSQHRQPLLPGISIAAPPDIKIVDGYGHYPHSLCGTGEDTDQLYVQRATELGLDNKNLAIIYDILNERAPQDHNPKQAECEEAMAAFSNSGNKVADLNHCGHILVRTKTRKCILAAGGQPIDVFIVCLNFRQFEDVVDCNDLKDVQESCGRKWRGPRVQCE